MKLDRGFKIKSSNPTAEMPKISFSCGLDKIGRLLPGLVDFIFSSFSLGRIIFTIVGSGGKKHNFLIV